MQIAKEPFTINHLLKLIKTSKEATKTKVINVLLEKYWFIPKQKRLLEQVKQGANIAINIEAQLVLITLGTAGFFDKFSIEETKNFKFDIVKSLRNNPNLVNIDVNKNLKVFEWSEKLLKAFSKLT